jgi:hypothetical protein
MTETAETDHDDQQPEAPPSVDVLAMLTIDELNSGSRQLKASLVRAVADETENYERGLAVVVWLHARRSDPAAQLGPIMRLTFTDLQDRIADIATAAAADEGPTTPTPEP